MVYKAFNGFPCLVLKNINLEAFLTVNAKIAQKQMLKVQKLHFCQLT